jgi:hypothetical protein
VRRAAALGPPSEEAAAEQIRAARAAFVELRLAEANAAFERALDMLLLNERRAADHQVLARVFFERALVAQAAQQHDRAARDMAAAVTLDPDLSPSRDEYGPPVFRAIDLARQRVAKGPTGALRVDRAPPDAVVRVDGKRVEPGAQIVLAGRGPHVLTAERSGYEARSELIDLDAGAAETRRAVVLSPATGAVLASQTLDAWSEAGGGQLTASGLTAALAVMVARALEIPFVVEARRQPSGDVDLVLRASASGEVERSVRGRRVEWEPWPWAALTEALEGRTVLPPVPPPPSAKPIEVPVAAAPAEAPPWYSRWYVWSAVGIALAAAAGTAVAVVSSREQTPETERTLRVRVAE